ncbi:MAG: hypothetical protein LBP33_00930 [Candidatus Adiutrix sp.]|jgi:hypothetical protein|nr:hypothetical protein [Candidatus Adiutrix sp.]
MTRNPLPARALHAALFAVLLGLGWTAPAGGQYPAAGRNLISPPGSSLTSALVRDELERRLAAAPRNEAAIWNTGYDFYRVYPRNQDTARAIKDGFLRARPNTDEQRLILSKAAIYWEKIHDYGVQNVPVGVDNGRRRKIYYGDPAKFSSLPMRGPGSRHQGFKNYDWPGRYLGRRAPDRGRPDNPYPGKYYPGMYPP